MIRSLHRHLLTWGALVLPLFAFAHNGEFLLAKLTLRLDGSCSLKVTADTEVNFTITDRAKLTEAAGGFFVLSSGKDTVALNKVAGDPTLSSAQALDPAAPLNHTPTELAKTYQLEVAEWNWTPANPKFILRVPEMSPHTFLLWLVDEAHPTAKPRWVMLIAEDESPLIEASHPAGLDGWDWLLIGVMVVSLGMPLLAMLALFIKYRRLAKLNAPKP